MTPDPADDILLQRYSDGDFDAFLALYQRHHPSFYRFACLRCPRAEWLRELMLESWAALHHRRAHLDALDLRQELIKQFRQALAALLRQHQHLLAADFGPDQQGRDLADVLCDAAQEPTAPLAALPSEQRETLLLAVLEGFAPDTIAGLCGVRLASVQRRLGEALTAIAPDAEDPSTAAVQVIEALLVAVPPAELDAAIARRIKFALAQEAKPLPRHALPRPSKVNWATLSFGVFALAVFSGLGWYAMQADAPTAPLTRMVDTSPGVAGTGNAGAGSATVIPGRDAAGSTAVTAAASAPAQRNNTIMGRAADAGQGPERAAVNLIRAADVIDPGMNATAARGAATASAWLSLIGKLIEAREDKEALDQWRRFQVAYPAHPVAPALAAQLKRIEAKP